MTDKFSLLDLVKQGKIEQTNFKPKIPTIIEGLNVDSMYVYRIPLDYLFFNEHNGRERQEVCVNSKNLPV